MSSKQNKTKQNNKNKKKQVSVLFPLLSGAGIGLQDHFDGVTVDGDEKSGDGRVTGMRILAHIHHVHRGSYTHTQPYYDHSLVWYYHGTVWCGMILQYGCVCV